MVADKRVQIAVPENPEEEKVTIVENAGNLEEKTEKQKYR